MDQGPLVNEQVRAGARLLAEFQKCFPVMAALWVKDEEGSWSLYVASDQITDDNFDVAYGEVVRIAAALRDDPWFDLFQVKVIGADHRLAKAAVQVQQRYSARIPGRFPGKLFSMNGNEVFLYPSPIPAPA